MLGDYRRKSRWADTLFRRTWRARHLPLSWANLAFFCHFVHIVSISIVNMISYYLGRRRGNFNQMFIFCLFIGMRQLCFEFKTLAAGASLLMGLFMQLLFSLCPVTLYPQLGTIWHFLWLTLLEVFWFQESSLAGHIRGAGGAFQQLSFKGGEMDEG